MPDNSDSNKKMKGRPRIYASDAERKRAYQRRQEASQRAVLLYLSPRTHAALAAISDAWHCSHASTIGRVFDMLSAQVTGDDGWWSRERRIVRFCAREMEQGELDAYSAEMLGDPELAKDVEAVMLLREALAATPSSD